MVFRTMASRPKRRRTKPSATATSPAAVGDETVLKDLVTECMSAAIPIIETTVKECLPRLKSNPGSATQAISPHQEESTTSIPSTSAFNAIVDVEPSTGTNL